MHLAATLERRFWTKVQKTESCWIWRGATDKRGYGKVQRDRRWHPAHRIAYEYVKGPIPRGLCLDHLCRNLPCVRPDHLEPVPHRMNVLRGISPPAKYVLRAHCVNGHAFDEANTRYRNDGRRCRACECERQRAYKARQRSKAEHG